MRCARELHQGIDRVSWQKRSLFKTLTRSEKIVGDCAAAERLAGWFTKMLSIESNRKIKKTKTDAKDFYAMALNQFFVYHLAGQSQVDKEIFDIHSTESEKVQRIKHGQVSSLQKHVKAHKTRRQALKSTYQGFCQFHRRKNEKGSFPLVST